MGETEERRKKKTQVKLAICWMFKLISTEHFHHFMWKKFPFLQILFSLAVTELSRSPIINFHTNGSEPITLWSHFFTCFLSLISTRYIGDIVCAVTFHAIYIQLFSLWIFTWYCMDLNSFQHDHNLSRAKGVAYEVHSHTKLKTLKDTDCGGHTGSLLIALPLSSQEEKLSWNKVFFFFF